MCSTLSWIRYEHTLQLAACEFCEYFAQKITLFTGIFTSPLFFFFFFFLLIHNGKTLKLQMSWQRVFLAVGLFGVLLLLTNADNSVHILSKYHQLITSTTLNWLPRTHYDRSKEIVIGGFEIEKPEGMSN